MKDMAAFIPSDLIDFFDRPTNPLYLERDAMQAQGEQIVDLVSGNINEQGLMFPSSIFQKRWKEAMEAACLYRPDPLGQLVARQAICLYYQEQGVAFGEEEVIVTPGTSLSYWYLFKVLAKSGDEILTPRPGYPLLDTIATLADLHLTYYRLRKKNRWEIDFDHLESQISKKTSAIVLISPHHPTGAVATEEEVEQLADVAVRYGLPIISDEVFCPFVFSGKRFSRPATLSTPLVATLNGFSKMFALPGLKIGWIALSGERSSVKRTKDRLETLSDTFLPVNEIAQFSVPAIFAEGKPFIEKNRIEIKHRLDEAVLILSQTDMFSFVLPEGGFYITIQIHAPDWEEEAMALTLLRRHRVLIHPGFLYDLEPSHCVISFTHPPERLKTSLDKLMGMIREDAPIPTDTLDMSN